MNATDLKVRWKRVAGAGFGIAALVIAVGCGTRDNTGVSAQAIGAGQAGMPVVVSCEPQQRAIVRPTFVNGTTVSQVECVAAVPTASYPQAQMMQPTPVPATYGYQTAAYPPPPLVRSGQPVLEDAQVVPPASRTGAVRPVRSRQVVYDDRETVRRGRSVKKSAIIIGSSAGVGAGVGAAVGGKKGALIGAAIGGGSAAIWDQVTRRN